METRKTSKFLVFLKEVNYEAPFTQEQIADLTQQHVDHIRGLDEKGILFLCGLLKGSEGGMFILNADTVEEAEDHVKSDPFIVNQCYKKYVIQEIQEANAGNNYLL